MNSRAILAPAFATLILFFSAIIPVSSAVADPILLSETGRLVSTPYPGEVNQIVIDDNYIYASLDDGGFEIRDKVTGVQLDLIRIELDAYAVQFVMRDQYVYVADWNYFTVLDISDKSNMVEADRYPNTSGYGFGVALQGDYAFYSMKGSGILTLDVSDPENITATGFLPESGGPEQFGVIYSLNEPNRLLAESYRGEYVYDTTDPNDLVETDTIATYPTLHVDYDSGRELMYVGYSGGSDNELFSIFDISNPDSIVELATYTETLPGGEKHYVSKVHRYDDYLFIVDRYRKMMVWDYSDPGNPVEVAYFPLPEDVERFMSGFAIDGDTAYIGTDRSGIIMVDIAPSGIPEPSTLLLASSGICATAFAFRRRKKK